MDVVVEVLEDDSDVELDAVDDVELDDVLEADVPGSVVDDVEDASVVVITATVVDEADVGRVSPLS